MSAQKVTNAAGHRAPRPVKLATPPFEIPAPDADETAPLGPSIRRTVHRRQFGVAEVIDTIRKACIEARNDQA